MSKGKNLIGERDHVRKQTSKQNRLLAPEVQYPDTGETLPVSMDSVSPAKNKQVWRLFRTFEKFSGKNNPPIRAQCPATCGVLNRAVKLELVNAWAARV